MEDFCDSCAFLCKETPKGKYAATVIPKNHVKLVNYKWALDRKWTRSGPLMSQNSCMGGFGTESEHVVYVEIHSFPLPFFCAKIASQSIYLTLEQLLRLLKSKLLLLWVDAGFLAQSCAKLLAH